ncbi:MAG: guanylate kinase [Mucinivorans sp.]
MNKVIIFSAPSGSGKTTIVRHLLPLFPSLEFSVSATSRAPRGTEQNGVDYYFLSPAAFAAAAQADLFVEWEEVYPGTSYGTLKEELDRIWSKKGVVVFDVDVVGGVNLKRLFGQAALSIFVMPPSIDELRKRLVSRATDTAEAIERRVNKAEQEITYAPSFDVVIVNDNLEIAQQEAQQHVAAFLATDK